MWPSPQSALLRPRGPRRRPKDRSIYYEDDAWLDITEWFDGNDYNPADEAIGRWDDEVYHFTDDTTSTDRDSDWNYRDYGYADTTAADNRWFYDYYDDGYSDWYDFDSDGLYDSYTWYYDHDNNGVYDAYTYYADTDGDGIYDIYDYYRFNADVDSSDNGKQVAGDQQKRAGSKAEKVAGEIQRVKTVQVHGTKHVIAEVRTSDGQTVAVDLGSDAKAASTNKKLQASGPRLKTGDKSLIVAMSAQVDGQDLKIQRDGRRYRGKVQSTREVKVRGQKHLMAKINTASGKKMMVDLGRADKLSSPPVKVSRSPSTACPVKIKDRVVLMARSLTRLDKTEQINRQPAKVGGRGDTRSPRPPIVEARPRLCPATIRSGGADSLR